MRKASANRDGSRTHFGRRTLPKCYNVSKCQVMHLSKDNHEFEYFMGSHKLEILTEGRDLGLQFANNL